MIIIVNSVEETARFAENLASKLKGNEIILLDGELGAGKTTFTKCLAKALGVTDIVTSPTFAFMKEYFGKYKLSHYDMYRADNEDELIELGISDNLEEDGICVIEWNKFSEFPKSKKIITIELTKLGEHSRELRLEGDYDESIDYRQL